MADLKQCDVCKNIIKDHLHVITIYELDLPNNWYKDKPRKKIEICRKCLSNGFTMIYQNFRNYRDV